MNQKLINHYSGTGMKMNEIQRTAFNKFNEYVYFDKIKIDIIDTCFCSSKNFVLLSKYDRFGLPFGTQICKNCGLITQNVRISDSSMELFYNEIYWDLISGKSRKIEFSTPPKTDDSSSFIYDLINLNQYKKIKIFEVGCGSGDRIFNLSQKLISSGLEVDAYGCDYSDEALILAQHKKINTIKGGFLDIAQYGKADVLILSHLFEHLADLHQALEHIDAICNEETLIYVELPGVIDLQNKKEYMYNYQDYNVLAHTYNFSLNTLSYVFSTKKFELIKGTEFVRAVFRKSKNTNLNIETSNNYNQIIEALKIAYEKDIMFQKRINNKYLKYFKNILKSLINVSNN
jgi:2-polyprenyl-3-methyl-5-hydroxy-6-metoxy-1,4-benzoquinol methylase